MTPDKLDQAHSEVKRLDTEIEKLEARLNPIKLKLTALKRKRRTIVAALASCTARDREAVYVAVRAQYEGAGAKYGIVKELAERYHLSIRQIQRIIK